MPAKHSRASTLQQRRLVQVATAAMSVVFVGVAAAAVLVDRSVEPAPRPTVVPPAAPVTTQPQDDAYEPFPPLIASGLSAVFELEPEATTPGEGEGTTEQPQIPPQEIALIAAIGQPGNMMAVIREGAAQTAIGVGQRAGSVDVLEVRPGWARVRHRGVEKELTIQAPLMLVSDMGVGGGAPMSTQVLSVPDADENPDVFEERGVTRTRMPGTFQRAQQGGSAAGGVPGGGRSGGSSGNRRPGGNQSNRPGDGNQAGNGTGGGTQGQGAEDDR